MHLKIFAVGGTIDKIYFDHKSTYQVGEPQVSEILKDANITFDFGLESIVHKDSLDMTAGDRQMVFDRVQQSAYERIVITHGTDTMIATAKQLKGIQSKTVVLTGAMQPARFRNSDAPFNIGCAIGAVQSLPHGTYLTMNGQVFQPDELRKNIEKGVFEEIRPQE